MSRIFAKKTRLFGLSISEEIFVPFNTISEHDGQTDRWTDISAIATPALA